MSDGRLTGDGSHSGAQRQTEVRRCVVRVYVGILRRPLYGMSQLQGPSGCPWVPGPAWVPLGS